MRKVLMVEFEHDEKDASYFDAALTDFLQKIYTLGYNVDHMWVHDMEPAKVEMFTPTLTSAEAVALAVETATAVDTPEDVVEVEEVEEAKPVNVMFASDEAGELAIERGLTTRNFQGLEPSSDNGFTVADVKKAAKRAGKA